MKILLLIPFLFATLANAQTWLKVANEGDSVIATATVRYGAAQGATATAGTPCATAGGCWAQLSVAGPFTANNTFFKKDPINGTAKELDVLETAAAQTVTVNKVAVIVPALPLPPPPPVTPVKTWTCTGVMLYSLMSDGTFQMANSGVVTCRETL
jgi:hypothetical protein